MSIRTPILTAITAFGVSVLSSATLAGARWEPVEHCSVVRNKAPRYRKSANLWFFPRFPKGNCWVSLSQNIAPNGESRK